MRGVRYAEVRKEMASNLPKLGTGVYINKGGFGGNFIGNFCKKSIFNEMWTFSALFSGLLVLFKAYFNFG